MIRFDFLGFIVVSIMIPQNAQSLFTTPVLSIINSTGNLTCYLDSINTDDRFHLCAIRSYTVFNDSGASQEAIVRNGISFTNMFSQLIRTRNCTGFSDTRDTGSGTCATMPYEIAQTMTLCICATDMCNNNLELCKKSNSGNGSGTVLPKNIIDDLTEVIECANASGNTFTCSPSAEGASFINQSACAAYVQDHSTLCAIDVNDIELSSQEALIAESYQSFLTDRLRNLQFLIMNNQSYTINETNTTIYITFGDDRGTSQECICAQNLFCNYNISTCSPYNIETDTITPAVSTEISATDTMPESATIITNLAIESNTPVTTTINSAVTTEIITEYSTTTLSTLSNTSTASSGTSPSTSPASGSTSPSTPTASGGTSPSTSPASGSTSPSTPTASGGTSPSTSPASGGTSPSTPTASGGTSLSSSPTSGGTSPSTPTVSGGTSPSTSPASGGTSSSTSPASSGTLLVTATTTSTAIMTDSTVQSKL